MITFVLSISLLCQTYDHSTSQSLISIVRDLEAIGKLEAAIASSRELVKRIPSRSTQYENLAQVYLKLEQQHAERVVNKTTALIRKLLFMSWKLSE
jgi:hypothetical protein